MERIVKYDYAFKLKCVKLVLEKHYSFNSISAQQGPSKSNISKWVEIYLHYGGVGLLPRTNQSYSVSIKLKVLQAIDKDLLSVQKTCIK